MAVQKTFGWEDQSINPEELKRGVDIKNILKWMISHYTNIELPGSLNIKTNIYALTPEERDLVDNAYLEFRSEHK